MVKGLKKGARFKRASTQSIKKVKGTWEISSTDYKVHDAKREEGLYYNEIKELQLGLTEYKGLISQYKNRLEKFGLMNSNVESLFDSIAEYRNDLKKSKEWKAFLKPGSNREYKKLN